MVGSLLGLAHDSNNLQATVNLVTIVSEEVTPDVAVLVSVCFSLLFVDGVVGKVCH